MVVRALIGAVLHTLPYSDQIPEFVDRILDEGNRNRSDDFGSSMEYPETSTTKRSRSATKQDIHRRLLDNRLKEKKDAGSNYLGGDYDNDRVETNSKIDQGATSKMSFFPESTLVDSSYDEHGKNEDNIDREVRIRQYLNEQNAKFDQLINANLDVFLKQQDVFRDEKTGTGTKNLVDFLFETTSSTVKHLPMFSKNTKNQKQNQEFDIMRSELNTRDSLNSLQFLADDDLDNSLQIELFVNTLPLKTRKQLLKELKKDLRPLDEKPLSKSSPDMIENLQIFTIVLIRLFFAGMRVFLPLVSLLYVKFANNQIIFINRKNFDKFLFFVTRLMKSLEKQLNNDNVVGLAENFSQRKREFNSSSASSESDRSSIPEAYTNDNMNDFYNEMAYNTASFISKNFIAGDKKWVSSTLRYFMGKYFPEPEPKYYTDPKYSKYFSHSSSSNESFQSAPGAEESLPEEDEGFSIMHAAEQFAKDLS